MAVTEFTKIVENSPVTSTTEKVIHAAIICHGLRSLNLPMSLVYRRKLPVRSNFCQFSDRIAFTNWSDSQSGQKARIQACVKRSHIRFWHRSGGIGILWSTDVFPRANFLFRIAFCFPRTIERIAIRSRIFRFWLPVLSQLIKRHPICNRCIR